MTRSIYKTEIIHKGNTPPCVSSGNQCRGCFGWPNMIRAAQANAIWRRFPLRCPSTGLTLRLISQDRQAAG